MPRRASIFRSGPAGDWRLPRVILPAALLSALAACSDGGAPQGGDRAAAGTVINDPFVIAIPQVGEIFDASIMLPAEISAVSYNVFDWLFDRDHQGSIKPGLAESWEMSADARELLITLRRDVSFHNGAPMTADDVVFSWDRMRTRGCCSTRVSRSLESIDVLDPHTVRIRFSQPEIGFIPVGGFPVLSRAYYDAVGEQSFKERPIGTGPYAIERLARGQYVELARYDAYWGAAPDIARARFKFVSEDTTRVAQLRSGEADMITQVPYPLVPKIEADPALSIETLSPGGMTVFLALKTDNPQTPWADRRVREAIALAIDHRAIVEDLLLGYPKLYPFLAPGDNGYDPELEPHRYDPERARALLAEAGATDLGLDIRYIAGGMTGQKESAEAVALYLNEVGIDARARSIEGPQFMQWVVQASKNPDQDYVAVFIGGVAGRAESANAIAAQFSSLTPFAWYANPEVNDLVAEMSRTPDPTVRAALIRQIGERVREDLRYIPLWTSSHIYGMKRCIEFTPTLGEYDLMLLRDVSVAGCDPAPAAP